MGADAKQRRITASAGVAPTPTEGGDVAVAMELARRLWRRDASLWNTPHAQAEIAARLGWLDSPDWLHREHHTLQDWARRIIVRGEYRRVFLLGMGGASLAGAVFAELFPPARGFPALEVVDTSHPDEIARLMDAGKDGDLHRTLFIVASKSGTTLETRTLYRYFREAVANSANAPAPAPFVLITDADSELHQLSQAAPQEFAEVFLNPSDIGGRYSALSYFGVVPAALLGVDLGVVAERARGFCATTKIEAGAGAEMEMDSALALASLLARGVAEGKGELLLRVPPRLRAFGMWIEQLIAESSGKDGKGLLPVVVADDDVARAHFDVVEMRARQIRVRIDFDEGGGEGKGRESNAENDCTLRLSDAQQIGGEFFRWQFATALSAAMLRINPFDQPDVEQSKRNARLFLHRHAGLGLEDARHHPHIFVRARDYDLLCANCGEAERDEAESADEEQSRRLQQDYIQDFAKLLRADNYLAVLAYLPQDAPLVALLHTLRARVVEAFGIACTLGFGPRYLHSTGQFHKGGPRRGCFVQFIGAFERDIAPPKCDYTFAQLCSAQADGDFLAVRDTTQPILRVRLKTDKMRALRVFTDDLIRAGDVSNAG